MQTTMAAVSADGSLHESIVDVLRAEEGRLYKDEQAKQLLSSVDKLVRECVDGLYQRSRPEVYAAALDRLFTWHPETAREEVANACRVRANPPLQSLLEAVCFKYVQMLYRVPKAKEDGSKLRIRVTKPTIESLVRGVYHRLADPLDPYGVRSGSFFALDRVRRDYIMRNVVRDTLAEDCIRASNAATGEPIGVSGEAVAVRPTVDAALKRAAQEAAAAAAAVPMAGVGVGVGGGGVSLEATGDEEGDGVPDGEVYPSDSISSVVDPQTAGGAPDIEPERPRLDVQPPMDARSVRSKATQRTAPQIVADDLRSVRTRPTAVASGAGAGAGGATGGASVRPPPSVASSSAKSAISRASQQRKPRVVATGDDDPIAPEGPKPTRRVVLTQEPDSPTRSDVRRHHRRRRGEDDEDDDEDDDDEDRSTATTSTRSSRR